MSFIFITVTRLDKPFFKPKNIRNSWAFICKVLVLILFSVDNLFIRIILIIKPLLITRAENAGFKNHHFQSFYTLDLEIPLVLIFIIIRVPKRWLECSLEFHALLDIDLLILGFSLILKKIIGFILFLTMIVLIVILLVGLIYTRLIIFWPRNLILLTFFSTFRTLILLTLIYMRLIIFWPRNLVLLTNLLVPLKLIPTVEA